jgi:hypothetical protein
MAPLRFRQIPTTGRQPEGLLSTSPGKYQIHKCCTSKELCEGRGLCNGFNAPFTTKRTDNFFRLSALGRLDNVCLPANIERHVFAENTAHRQSPEERGGASAAGLPPSEHRRHLSMRELQTSDSLLSTGRTRENHWRLGSLSPMYYLFQRAFTPNSTATKWSHSRLTGTGGPVTEMARLRIA